MFCQPHLDDGLARDTNAFGLAVEGGNHPNREIHIHALLFFPGTARFGYVKLIYNAFSVIEFLFKFRGCCFHIIFFHLLLNGAQK